MKATLEVSKTRNSAHEKLRRWLKVSICVLALVSVAAVFYSAFSSTAAYHWQCPACDTRPTATAAAVANATAASPTNISHIMFGIGGSAATWLQRQAYIELWWRPDVMRGHVWLESEPLEPWPGSCPPYRISAANTSRYGSRADAARIARIVADAYLVAPPGVRWFVMGDDDTVFFTENLVAVLGRYDHEEMWYIGASSESVEQNVMHSYGMAFGGGGFAVSFPAAAALAGAIDGCLDRYSAFYGSDQRVQACFAEIGVPLTREVGFHQVDLRGDVYGMLAAHPVAPLLSLHHLDYVKPIDPRSTQLDVLRFLVGVAQHDPGRVLQQAVCYVHEPGRGIRWSVSVSWGYTVQLYPWILSPKDLLVPLRTFRTWRSSSSGPFTFNTRVLPGPDRPCERPLVYFLDRIHDGKEGSTLTEYSRYEAEENSGRLRCGRTGFDTALKVGSVRVSAPRMEAEFWTRKAPRRQCCDAQRVVGWFSSKNMEVTIRDCYPGEITSVPKLCTIEEKDMLDLEDCTCGTTAWKTLD